MTDLLPREKEAPLLPSLHPREKPMIVFASNDVNDDSLFLNGLTQNILILYDLFESLGYSCFMLQHQAPTTSNKKGFIAQYKTVTVSDMIKTWMPIKALIEIGMSVDPDTRGYLRSIGAKIAKLYLGNILNIDVETIQNYQNMFFHHHIVGELDQIWTSPHYRQHVEYAAVLNRCPAEKGKVVPYVWDPCFLTRYGKSEEMEWHPHEKGWESTDVVIMDPNISFQKYSFYSLLLLDQYAKEHPEWKGNVYVINGDRLLLTANARNRFLPRLALYEQGRIQLLPRKKIHEMMREYRSACFITHQWNNEYNYATLELMYCGYPILHNSEGWSAYGYYYDINKWSEAVQQVHAALQYHATHQMTYRTHAMNLVWKHSIHHPQNQQNWKQIMDELVSS